MIINIAEQWSRMKIFYNWLWITHDSDKYFLSLKTAETNIFTKFKESFIKEESFFFGTTLNLKMFPSLIHSVLISFQNPNNAMNGKMYVNVCNVLFYKWNYHVQYYHKAVHKYKTDWKLLRSWRKTIGKVYGNDK